MLTNEDKISIIDTHIKMVTAEKYNIDILLEMENAVNPPDQPKIDDLNQSLAACLTKLAVLESNKSALTN